MSLLGTGWLLLFEEFRFGSKGKWSLTQQKKISATEILCVINKVSDWFFWCDTWVHTSVGGKSTRTCTQKTGRRCGGRFVQPPSGMLLLHPRLTRKDKVSGTRGPTETRIVFPSLYGGVRH